MSVFHRVPLPCWYCAPCLSQVHNPTFGTYPSPASPLGVGTLILIFVNTSEAIPPSESFSGRRHLDLHGECHSIRGIMSMSSTMILRRDSLRLLVDGLMHLWQLLWGRHTAHQMTCHVVVPIRLQNLCSRMLNMYVRVWIWPSTSNCADSCSDGYIHKCPVLPIPHLTSDL